MDITKTQSYNVPAEKQKQAEAPASADTIGKEAFLKLLVAQIRNQDPLNPADGVQFLTQLAQFSELEQMMGIRKEVELLRQDQGNKTEGEN